MLKLNQETVYQKIVKRLWANWTNKREEQRQRLPATIKWRDHKQSYMKLFLGNLWTANIYYSLKGQGPRTMALPSALFSLPAVPCPLGAWYLPFLLLVIYFVIYFMMRNIDLWRETKNFSFSFLQLVMKSARADANLTPSIIWFQIIYYKLTSSLA